MITAARLHKTATIADDDRRQDDQFEAFDIISKRANGLGFRTNLFKTNMEIRPRQMGSGEPNLYHPSNWAKWTLPEAVVVPTQGNTPKPRVRVNLRGFFAITPDLQTNA